MQGLPKMCQVTSIDLILHRCQLAKDKNRRPCVKKITLKWWHDWFVIFRMIEAGKNIEVFPIHQQVNQILDSKFKLGEIKFNHIMLHSGLFTWKGYYYYSFTDVFGAVAINIRNKVSFNAECLKNFLPFSSVPFTISRTQLKEADYFKKL